MEKLIKYLNGIAQMSLELEQHLRNILKCEKFKKKQCILRKGQVCQNIRFIESGLIRIFRSGEGKDVIMWIQRENEIFISSDSFFAQTPSEEEIEALEPTVTWCTTYKGLEETCLLYPEFMKHHRVIKMHYEKVFHERTAKLKDLNPEQKFNWLQETDPELLLRVPKKLLPIYLEISRNTFYKYQSQRTGRKVGK